ncbi:MAG: anthranilate synthase component I [Thermomicrobiales bacterium]|nr:anthranilate synthase component I [Thermomicrobiales bacterium]
MTTTVRGTQFVQPSLDEVKAIDISGEIKTVPIYREVFADMETPVSVYLKLTDGASNPGFVLESIEGGTQIARYSFIGASAAATVTLREGEIEIDGTLPVPVAAYDDPLDAITEILAPYHTGTNDHLPRFTGGAVGFLSYDAIRRFESRVPRHRQPGIGLPEAQFFIADTLVVFDHLERVLKVVSHVQVHDPAGIDAAYNAAVERINEVIDRLNAPLPGYAVSESLPSTTVQERRRPNMTADTYRQMIESGKKYIRQGDIFQVVLSQRVDIDTPAHPFSIYRALRTVNPSPYMFYLDFGAHQIVGASPELLVRLEGGVVSNHPIAGTRPRGATVEQDNALAAELISDEKERAEHVMLVDLGRNDIGRVSKPGTVRLPKMMEIERFSHVMHIVSNVDGDIRDEFSAEDALRACFPAGTVSGAPKVRAMEIIAELEEDARGVYSGAVGYIDFSGEMDTCIALRTLVYKDGVASLQAGGGIVADSTAEGEYQESINKMAALVRAIERAEQLEVSTGGRS